MQKFKAGDRVVRTGTSVPHLNMFTGRTYTVSSYHTGSTKWINLVGIEGAWVERYFVLDEETFNGNT